MPSSSPTPGGSRRRRPSRSLGRITALAAAAIATVGVSQSVAAPSGWLPPTTDGEVKVTSAFATPISATEPICTPEPGGQNIYGTQVPFDPAKPEADITGFGYAYPAAVNSGPYNHPAHPDYEAANKRSRDTLVKTPQAGAMNDLCFGFTLTPNLEPYFQATEDPTRDDRNVRLQNDPPLPDVRQTHVSDAEEGDDLKNVVIDMPAGFAATLKGLPTCSESAFGLGNYADVDCPVATQVGSLFTRVSARLSASQTFHVVVGGVPGRGRATADPGRVFALPHGPNELARLGVFVSVYGIAPVKLTVRMVLTPEGRVRAITENAPRRAYRKAQLDRPNVGDPAGTQYTYQPLPGEVPGYVYLESFGIRVWGASRTVTTDPNKAVDPTTNPQVPSTPFAEWGTQCGTDLKADVSIETYAGTKSSISSDPVQLTGCDQLPPFQPSLEVNTSEKTPGVPTGVEVKVGVGQAAAGAPLKTPLLRDAAVTLPPGLEIGAQVASGANGLPLCSAAQFGKGTVAPSTCPAGSKVGDVNIVSPLIDEPLTGGVYLGPQAAVGELPNLFIEATPAGATGADAPRIKLVGDAKVDAEGRLTTTFKDAPQLRFSELRLTFPGGANALFSTPRACGSTKATGSFVSWASAAPVTVESPALTIDQGCDVPAFAPSFSMVPANAAVGASSATKVTIERPDRSAWLKDVKVSLPSGFLADLKVATECSKADAAAGACPESARIASVTTAAGVGEKPLSLDGSMYLVERDEGAVAGAVIVVRAKIGELDLGNVVVPGRIDLRPTDAGLVLTTSAPLRFRGLALNLRSITVNLDREAFPLNPTACGPLRATAELTGDGGQTAAPTSDVTYTGCGDLPFQPAFQAKVSGDTKANGYPQIDVTMLPRAGDSNLKGARVALPVGLATDTANLKNVCPRDQFDAGSCADATKVGTVTAAVSITNDVISGSVHLVRVEGSNLPGIGMVFSGRYSTRVLSSVKVDGGTGRLITDFASIPDLPLRRLDMTIAGGPKAPIKVSPKACTADTAWDATFTGQGGKTSTVSVPVKCEGLTPEPKQTMSWSAKKGLKFTLTAPTGKTLKSGKITLPKGFKFTTKKSLQKKYAKVKASGSKGKSKITKTSISFTATKSSKGATKVTITVKPKGYSLPKSYKGKLKKGKKLKIKSRVVSGDGKVTAKTLTVKAKK